MIPFFIKVCLISICLFFSAQIAFGQNSAYVADVVGDTPSSTPKLKANVPIDFVINFRIESGNLTGCTNGFLFSSPDGATWLPITTTTNPILPSFLDGQVIVNQFDVDGISPDIVAFGAFSIFADGVPNGYDGWVMTHSTMFSDFDVGKTFCLDSTWYPPASPWQFSTTGGNFVPTWSGPHCYEIVSCCIGIRGNLNYSEDDTAGITDLDYLIKFLFRGGAEPICWAEGNVDGDIGEQINISDVTYLVDWMFRGGPAPPSCS